MHFRRIANIHRTCLQKDVLKLITKLPTKRTVANSRSSYYARFIITRVRYRRGGVRVSYCVAFLFPDRNFRRIVNGDIIYYYYVYILSPSRKKSRNERLFLIAIFRFSSTIISICVTTYVSKTFSIFFPLHFRTIITLLCFFIFNDPLYFTAVPDSPSPFSVHRSIYLITLLSNVFSLFPIISMFLIHNYGFVQLNLSNSHSSFNSNSAFTTCTLFRTVNIFFISSVKLSLLLKKKDSRYTKILNASMLFQPNVATEDDRTYWIINY